MTHTILIVEDNEKNMKLVRDVLQAKGYATLEAVTGEETATTLGQILCQCRDGFQKLDICNRDDV